MSDIQAYSTIPEIRKQVKEGLAGYFDEMSSGEFEGSGIFPEDSETKVAVFLAACANHSAAEIKDGFQGVLDEEGIASAYEEAQAFIGKEQHLTIGVMGIARKLDIPVENLVIL